MARTFFRTERPARRPAARLRQILRRDDAVLDVLGGVWLVTLLLGLLNLPALLA
ncbi:hypothetical protein [Jannaschia sp. W003]|uniref:hypothetical protein n=1 Tax=Jannaschia sp. W003 TaxID=2867012 RepID=UPI0021A64E69|nr:hypothetical protein [Jannaschia sp. W003]UWQ20287.1 hypothetical protein K3554_09780 [Jannaschia sp. W003]